MSMCRQVDALFATFLEQIQPSGLQLVTMGQPHQSQLHQPQAPHQTFTVGGQQILLTSAASADQTLADIIAGGADSDLLHHLMPVGGSGASANTPQTITINHFGTGNATTWETIQTADGSQLLATSNANASAEQSQAPPQSSQPPPKQSGGKRKNSNMPTATKTSTVATKSRPPPTATNIRVIPETTAFSLSAPGQAGSSGMIDPSLLLSFPPVDLICEMTAPLQAPSPLSPSLSAPPPTPITIRCRRRCRRYRGQLHINYLFNYSLPQHNLHHHQHRNQPPLRPINRLPLMLRRKPSTGPTSNLSASAASAKINSPPQLDNRNPLPLMATKCPELAVQRKSRPRMLVVVAIRRH